MLRRATRQLIVELRDREMKRIKASLARPNTSSVVIVGARGMGKSTLLGQFEDDAENGFPKIIDLGMARNRSLIGLAASLLQDFNTAKTADFYRAASDARKTGNERSAREALLISTEIVAQLQPRERGFLFDNIDRASSRVQSWLFSNVFNHKGIKTISAAKSIPIGLSHADVINVDRFERSQLEKLGAFWGEDIGVKPMELTTALLQLSHGHPVLAALLAWSLSFRRSAPIEGDTSIEQSLSESLAILGLSEINALSSGVFAYQRINATIYRYLFNGEDGHAAETFLAALPVTSKLDDAVGGIVIHPVAREAIQRALGLNDYEVEAARNRLVTEIYPRLMGFELGYDLLGNLELERLRYLITLHSLESHRQLEKAFREHLLRGRLSRADEIAQIVEESLETDSNYKPTAFTLLRAENAIARNEIQEAWSILRSLQPRDLAVANSELRVRVQLLKAMCITSPAGCEGEDIYDAAGILENAKRDAETIGVTDLMEQIELELGFAYRLIAQNQEALKCYQSVERNAKDTSMAVRAVEEQANLYRLMQDLDRAEEAANRATGLMLGASLSVSAFGLYTLANIRRDQNRFADAELLYERALTIAQNDIDDYLLCVIYGDMAWMKFLEGDLNGCRTLVDDYRRLAEVYSFSRELAEYWHIRYHISIEEENWERAYRDIHQSYKLATGFGNVLMQLDCLMHLVQKAVKERQIDDTTALIDEMKQVEERGCGIKVFRGRARIYQGDGLLAAQREREGLMAWKEGFETVASFGESRSNVELLSDLLNPRYATFSELLRKYKIDENWPSNCNEKVRKRIDLAMR